MRPSHLIGDEYDRRAFERLVTDLAKGPSILDSWGGRAAKAIGAVGRRASSVLPAAVTTNADQALRASLAGLQRLTIDPALRSVSRKRVLQSYRREGHLLGTLEDIRSLDLRTVDSISPSLSWRYAVGAAVEGAGAGLTITGGELLASLGSIAGAGAGAAPGAGTVLGAIAFDAAAVLAASARVVAHTGAFHGYDTRLPEEELFALTVISWSSAGTEGAKVAAFHQLSRLTQQLVRGSTWGQLSQHVLVKVAQEIYTRLGLRLTQRKLGQAVPVAGVVLGAGMNASLLRSIGDDARSAYRLRFLVDKYGLDLGAGRMPAKPVEHDDVIDVEAILDDVEQRELADATDPGAAGDDRGGSS